MTAKVKSSYEIELFLPAIKIDREGSNLMKLDKESLRSLVAPLADLLKNHIVVIKKGSDPVIADMMRNICDSKYFNKLLKAQYATLYISFVRDLSNLVNVVKTDSRLEETWRHIIKNPEITSEEINNLTGHRIGIFSGSYWGSFYYCDILFFPLVVLIVDTSYRRRADHKDPLYTLSLYASLRSDLARKFFGETCLDAVILESLPAYSNLVTEDFEKYIPADLSFLSGLAMTGNVVSSTGSITAAKIKSVKKTFKTGEFKSREELWPLDRIELLINAYFLFECYGFGHKEPRDTANTGKFAKFVVDKLAKYITSTKFGAFLPAFKGFTKVWTESTNADALTKIIHTLIAPAAEGWMDMNNLKLRYLSSNPVKSKNYPIIYYPLFSSDSRMRHTLKRKNDELDIFASRSSNISWFEEIDFPFVLHWLKFLCAAGLLEIALENTTEPNKHDEMEGMRYLRLTSLGRYALGFDKEYLAEKPDVSAEMEIDDANGIITILSDNCPYTFFLEQVSTKISKNRFHITPESLMKNCDSANKLFDRLDNLEVFIDIDKYTGFGAIIDEAENRVRCAERLDDDYIILKLKTGLPGLVRLIMTNTRLRSNVILAEQGICLVKSTFMAKFKEICCDHGYLLD